MKKILFICHGNICRSPMAEFVMKDLVEKANLTDDFFINSKATSTEEIGNGVHYGTINELKKHGIKIYPHTATQIKKDDYQNFDFLICMDKNNIRNLSRIMGTDVNNKIFLLLEFSNLDNNENVTQFIKTQQNANENKCSFNDNLRQILTQNNSNLNLEIDDPWYSGNFAKTYTDIKKGCKSLLKILRMI